MTDYTATIRRILRFKDAVGKPLAVDLRGSYAALSEVVTCMYSDPTFTDLNIVTVDLDDPHVVTDVEG